MENKMKDSGIEAIGLIPDNWELTATKNLFSIIAGGTPDTGDSANFGGSIAWITPADYKTDNVYIESGKRNLSSKGYNCCSAAIVPAGSIIFSKRAPIGSVAISSVPLCTNQGCLSCVSNKKKVNVKYFYYVMSVLTDAYELLGSGTTFKEISAKNFGIFKLPQPAMDEQKKIVAFLDSKVSAINALISNQEKQIKKLNEYRQAIITKAVTKGLDPNAPMKDSGVEGIGDIPLNWDFITTKNLFSIIAGATPNTNDTNNFDGSIVWITPADYKTEDEYICIGKRNLSKKGLETCSATVVPNGSIVFSKRAPIGSVAISSVPLCTNQGCLSCVCDKNKLNAKYYYYVMSTLTENYELLGSGTTFKEISAKNFGSVKLPNPSIDEQNSIVKFLDKKITNLKRLINIKLLKIEKLENYKRSLIYEYVTGKKRVQL